MSLQRCEGGCGEKMPEAPQLAPDSSPALAPEQDSVSLITELINSEMKDMKEMEDKAQGDIVWIGGFMGCSYVESIIYMRKRKII